VAQVDYLVRVEPESGGGAAKPRARRPKKAAS
jgi:hypothetical protein